MNENENDDCEIVIEPEDLGEPEMLTRWTGIKEDADD